MAMIITAGQVLTRPGAAPPLPNAGVLVDGTTIAAVGPIGQLRAAAPAGTAEEHHPSATLLPGLINAHVHLGFDTTSNPAAALLAAPNPEVRAAMLTRAEQLLDAGVTTARDLGDRDGLASAVRDIVDRHERPGPRLLVATTPLTSLGGHCDFLGGEVGTEPDHADVHAQVHANADAGADWIKLMASGGKMTPTSPPLWANQFDTATVTAAVAAAHDHGLPIAVHAHGVAAIDQAVVAGADTVEHCGWRTAGGGIDLQPSLAARMAAHNMIACPTPTPNWRRLTDKVGEARAEAYYRRLAWLHEQGVTMIWGTDAGTPGSGFTATSDSLTAFTHVGFTPGVALGFATTTAARALHLPTGALEPGLAADLLLVDGDPLTDLTSLSTVRLVMARGRPPRRPVPTGRELVGRATGRDDLECL